jgi:hypothetical protein
MAEAHWASASMSQARTIRSLPPLRSTLLDGTPCTALMKSPAASRSTITGRGRAAAGERPSRTAQKQIDLSHEPVTTSRRDGDTSYRHSDEMGAVWPRSSSIVSPVWQAHQHRGAGDAEAADSPRG